MSIRARAVVLCAAVSSVLFASLPAQAVAKQVAAPAPALFQVGAAAVDVTPTTPLYIGGYGKQTIVSSSHDPLEVRAFVVAKGDKAVAFVILDSTGWFAEYQGAEAGLGTLGARTGAAQKLVEHGFNVDRSAVIVSSTHVHAAPTITGIWGTSSATPEGKAYLKRVRDAVVTAVDQAAANLKTSELWTSTGNVRSFIWQNGQGTNHPDGFPVDEQMPVLWARDPATGATNALYVNVPNHPDQFDGAGQGQFSADFPGYVRHKLDATIGGTSVIASGTLGRQEPPGSDPTYAEVERQGEYVSNAIMLALSQAQPLTSDTLRSTETFMSTTADNAGLLGLMGANVAYGPICSPALGGNCTIPRAFAAPWFVDGSPKKLGTWINSIRVGSLLYVSNPSESFAEVNEAIRDGVLDATAVNVVGLSGDFLGYNWVRGQYTDTEFGSSNFKTYNLGPDIAQQTADINHANAKALGFTTTTDPQPVVAVKYGDIRNLPGIQFYPTQLESTNPTVKFYVNKTTPQYRRNDPLSEITWDFGDGSSAVTGIGWQQHTFPGPGNYQVTASVRNLAADNPGTRTWTETIVIDPELTVATKTSWRAGKTTRLHADVSGGHGKVIAATWTCPSGDVQHGLDVTCESTDKGGVAQVKVVDGAGNVSTAEVDISPAR